MNRRKLLVVEVVAAGGAVAQRLENSRDRSNSRQGLLGGERAEGDVIVDKGRARLLDHLFVGLHVGNPLPVAVPQRIEQLRKELFPCGGNWNAPVWADDGRIPDA